MLDGLPSDGAGRYSVGSWGALLLAVGFALAAGGALLWMLWWAADMVGL